MQTENFVTFDQAKRLKELGYDWECDFIYYITYHNHDKPVFERCETADHYNIEEYWNAPTLSQAQKWLMDKNHILISIRPNDFVNDSGNTEIHYTADIFGTSKGYLELLNSESGYETYEFALEDGINEALNILERKNE